MKTIDLTIIVLSYNTKEILRDCLNSLQKLRSEIGFEVIVSDNGSTDGSPVMVREKFKWVKLVSGPNISFSNGNNRAKKITKGKYVLLLNSDTLVHKNTLKTCVNYLQENSKVGALTCKLILPDGSLDKDARRRFPTPWISFKRLFLGNGKEYWYEDMPSDATHEVDAIEGAFFMTRKNILDRVGWLDENYIFDGEDIDLSFQIKRLGYKIMYLGKVSIIHIKKASRAKLTDAQIKRKMEGVNSMETFYKKNLWDRYPLLFNWFVLMGIKFLKSVRYIKAKL